MIRKRENAMNSKNIWNNHEVEVPMWPYSDKREEEQVIEVLRSGCWWRNAGTKAKLFEKEFAAYQDCKGGISVANGTVAIEVALKSLDIKEGDEVIVPAFTFYSTISAVLAVKAIPVIVDVLADTYCIDPQEIRRAITDKTKAIIPVHMAGQMADMDAILEIADQHHLYVIEDSSHAHGAEYKGKKAGSFGTCGTFSFQNAKLMTAGEGGIILSNDSELLNRILLEANCGRAENDTTYQHVLVGTNARLSEMQGAVLSIQLSRLDEQIKLREKNYQYLVKKLQEIPGIELQVIKEECTVNPHYMVMFRYDKSYFENRNRDEFVKYLKSYNIPCNRSFESLNRLPVFKKLDADKWRVCGTTDQNGMAHCINSENISENVVCLNHNILLGNETLLDSIVDIIKSF